MLELLFVLAVAAAVRGLVQQTRRDLARWRNRPPPARGGGGVLSALRRVTAGGTGYWAHQAAHGFPTARAGLHDGWMRAVEADHRARRQIAQARAEHAEGRTELGPELDDLRQRRKAALAELDRQQAERDRAAHEEWLERNRQALAADQERIRREAERERIRWQARQAAEAQRELDRLRQEREQASATGGTFSCRCCGGDDTGTGPLCGPCTAAGCEKSRVRDGEVSYWNCQRDDGQVRGNWDRDPPLPGEDGYGTTGNPPPDCWLCGLPVAGDELGASAHQRCVEVNDRDMERAEVADDRDIDEVERDMRGQGRCPWQVAYGEHGGSSRYCGQPINGDDDEFCPWHQAEDENDYGRAAEEIHRHTRELLAAEPASPQDEKPADPGQQGQGGANRGDNPVETSYAGVKARMKSAAGAAEQRQAEAKASEAACEERVSEAESAKSWAETTADQMQALEVDAATLGAMAEHLDALVRAKAAEEAVLEAVQQARKAWGEVLESAQKVTTQLDASGHGGVQEARDNAAAGGGKKEFYEEGAA